MLKVITVLLVIMVIVAGNQAGTIHVLRKELATANQAANEATRLAYGDCQRIIQNERIMSYMNGCYGAVENLCGGQSQCMKKLGVVCATDY